MARRSISGGVILPPHFGHRNSSSGGMAGSGMVPRVCLPPGYSVDPDPTSSLSSISEAPPSLIP